MDYEELKKQLNALYDIELNNYLLHSLAEKVKERKSNLCKKREIAPPRIYKPYKDKVYPVDVKEYMYICAPIFAVIGYFLMVHLILIDFTKPSFGDKLMAYVLGGPIGALIGAVAGFLLCGPLIAGFVRLVKEIVVWVKYYIELKNAEPENSLALKEYEARVLQEKRRIELEEGEFSILSDICFRLTSRRIHAQENLEKLYDAVGIDPQFRALIPIGYMNDFARLGIATKLEGTDGLYYLVLKELRADCFQCTLNDISSKLDTLIDQQSMLYRAVVNLGVKVDSLAESIERETMMVMNQIKSLDNVSDQLKNSYELSKRILDNSKVNAYNSDRIAKELEYMHSMIEDE